MQNPKGKWIHTSGKEYEVVMITNESSDNHEKYPPTVVYRGVANGKLWSRPLSDWDRSFTKNS